MPHALQWCGWYADFVNTNVKFLLKKIKLFIISKKKRNKASQVLWRKLSNVYDKHISFHFSGASKFQPLCQSRTPKRLHFSKLHEKEEARRVKIMMKKVFSLSVFFFTMKSEFIFFNEKKKKKK
jgi:hypothetical protein